MTREQAEAAGWSFDIDGENGAASKDGSRQFEVASSIPLFSMLREVAEREGDPLDDAITAELVEQVSGETYDAPAPPDDEPPPEPEPDATEVVRGIDQALAALPEDPTPAQIVAAVRAVTSQV